MLYLDICALKRPFDDQSQARVREEAAAVLDVLARIEAGQQSLTWSDVLSFENDQDPDLESRRVVARWESRATSRIALSKALERRASGLEECGLHSLDALHLASAEFAGSEVLLTCDDRFLRRAKDSGTKVRVMNPVDYVREAAHESESD